MNDTNTTSGNTWTTTSALPPPSSGRVFWHPTINGQWQTYTPVNTPTYAVGSARDAPNSPPQPPAPPDKPKPWSQMTPWDDPNNPADDNPVSQGAWLEAVMLAADPNATKCYVKCTTESTGGPTSGDNVDVKQLKHELTLMLVTWFVSP